MHNMEILGIVIIGILLFAIIIGIFSTKNENSTFNTGLIFGIILSILVSIEVDLLSSILEEPTNPTAMDVYQGKTTLEYTIRDNVKIDSIVVFKNKNSIYGKEN